MDDGRGKGEGLYLGLESIPRAGQKRAESMPGRSVLRAFDRQESESDKAFRAWVIYRDLGVDRSLRRAAALFYGTPEGQEPPDHLVNQLKKWSSRFDWQGRLRALQDRDEMMFRSRLEELREREAEDFAAMEADIRKQAIRLRRRAMKQAEFMLEWPSVEQQQVITGENGEELTQIFAPARWSKRDAIHFFNMGVGNAFDQGAEDAEDTILAFDPESMTEEELELHRRYLNQAKVVPYEPPEDQDQDHPPR